MGWGFHPSGVPRDQIFLITKLWRHAHLSDDVELAFTSRYGASGTDYVDFRLMHYPCAFKRRLAFLPAGPDGKVVTDTISFIDTRKAIEKLLKTGQTRAIGIWNFSSTRLEVVRLQVSSSVLHFATYQRKKETEK